LRRPWSCLCPAAVVIFCQLYFCATVPAAGPSEAFSSQAPVVPFSNGPLAHPPQPKPKPKPKAVVITLVTVAQLQQWLAASRGMSDSAQQLSSLKLTEPLGSQELATMMAELRGKKSRQALTAIADVSEFLDPPQAELPADAPPDSATQTRMISLTESYLRKTLPKLPDFTATRTVVDYEEEMQYSEYATVASYEHDPQYSDHDNRIAYKPLQLSDRYKEKVLYRDGHEVTNAELQKNKTRGPEDRYLITRGTFGPLLGWVDDAIAVPDALTWNRWEQSGNGRLAVFRYQVPVEKSRFQIKGCCLPDGGEVKGFIKTTGYSGEIAIDPQSGAILRLVFRADLIAIPPLVRSDILVEYGPVDIGGKTYICPVRSVSLWRGRSVIPLSPSDKTLGTFGPYVTALNDMTFDHYRVFRSESRILPSFKPVQ
jgi:hypothetical protein